VPVPSVDEGAATTTTTAAVSVSSIKKVRDEDIQSAVLEIVGSNLSRTFITCPADPNKALGIKLRTSA